MATSLSAQDFTTKIIGGKDATPDEYPWMAALLDAFDSDNYQAQFCGGVLIHPYYVLTAAHCVEGESAITVDILVGTDDLDVGGRRINVISITRHPLYNSNTIDYDMAIIRLATPVTDIEPVGIADLQAWQKAGVVGRVLGWGQSTFSGAFPTQLQEADVTIDPFDAANDAWDGSLTESMMPASNPGGLPDTCNGDSGGPLLVKRPIDGAWVVAGITSFGAGCGADDPPAIYTRVFALREFVYQKIYPDFYTYMTQYGQYSITADTDGDGLRLYEEFGYNTNPNIGDLSHLPQGGSVLLQGSRYATLTFTRRRNATSFQFLLEQAPTLEGPWEAFSLAGQMLSRTTIDTNTEIVTLRAADAIDGAPFLRLRYEPTGAL